MWHEEKVAGTSDDRPWERVGGYGFDATKKAPLALEDTKPDGGGGGDTSSSTFVSFTRQILRRRLIRHSARCLA